MTYQLQKNVVVFKVIVQIMVLSVQKVFPGGGCKDFSGFDRTTWPKHDLQNHCEHAEIYKNATHKLQENYYKQKQV